MATNDPLRPYHVDETSCGPLCQHPQCWASNRRTERGLPRLKDPTQSSWDDNENEGALPTQTVQNLLAQSGLGLADSFPKQTRPGHHRSSSAPTVDLENRTKPKFPSTPYTSPLGLRSFSAQSMPASLPEHQRRPSKAHSVQVRELFEVDELNSDWQKTFMPSQVYVWCPSKKAYERQLRSKRDPTPELTDQKDVSKPVTVKDMTDVMVPNIPKEKTKRTKKMKKKPSRITPTGGRPYTHPSRSPQLQRRTLPGDMDESISQLLTLPRDILMDVLVHIQNSESLNKEKVQVLMSQLMPLIHFDQNQPMHRALSPTPLLASGILQNKKMSLLQGRQPRHAEQSLQAAAAAAVAATSQAQRSPFYLDDSLISAMTTSTYAALTEQLPLAAEDDVAAGHQEPTRETGRMARKQPLAPIQAVPVHNIAPPPQGLQIRNKLTSVSTKSLPPLAPGSKPTKPFDYKGAKSLDLTLGPLPSPDQMSPEKPSTPRSERASTLYVTMPSVLSHDRTEMTTPLQPYGRLSAPGFAERFANQYLHDTPSPIASEDFHPLHAVSPSLSTGVPHAPLGTPATTFRQPFHPQRSTSQQRSRRSPSPTKGSAPQQREANSSSGPAADPQTADALGTIQEARSEMVTSYQDTTVVDTSLPSSPLKHGMTPVSTPWGNCTTITNIAASDRASRSPAPPVTPRPSTATPELWPVVDERDFMTSPEKPHEMAMAPGQSVSLTTPTAPPPSPEPQELKEFEFAVNDLSKSTVNSLTPLVEEGEEEGEEEDQEEARQSPDDKEALGDDKEEEDQAIHEEELDTDGIRETEDLNPNTVNQTHPSAPDEPKNETSADEVVSHEDRSRNVVDQETSQENTEAPTPDLPPSGDSESEPLQVEIADTGLNMDREEENLQPTTHDSFNEAVDMTREAQIVDESPHPFQMEADPSDDSVLKSNIEATEQTDINPAADQDITNDPYIPPDSDDEQASDAAAFTAEGQHLDNKPEDDNQTESSLKREVEPGQDKEVEEEQASQTPGAEESRADEDQVEDTYEEFNTDVDPSS